MIYLLSLPPTTRRDDDFTIKVMLIMLNLYMKDEKFIYIYYRTSISLDLSIWKKIKMMKKAFVNWWILKVFMRNRKRRNKRKGKLKVELWFWVVSAIFWSFSEVWSRKLSVNFSKEQQQQARPALRQHWRHII